MIKARTMYNMVEEIDGVKLLFLTNPQADLIASGSESVQKMLDALEVGRPSLVINLLTSFGFADATRMVPSTSKALADELYLGIVPDRAPFLTRDSERGATHATRPGQPLHIRAHALRLEIPSRLPFAVAPVADVDKKLDMFMADILIPLAAQTNAIVLCNATRGACALSSSFMRMSMLARAKWSGRTPYTILGSSNDVDEYYRNEDLKATWRELRRA